MLESINADLEPSPERGHEISHEQPELSISPCGKVVFRKSAVVPEGRKTFCTQILCTGNPADVVHCDTRLPAWTHIAWHPAAGLCPMFAMATDDGIVLLVDARGAEVIKRWRHQDLDVCPSEEQEEGEEVPGIRWKGLTWMPDGTKLLLTGADSDASAVIDFMKPFVKLPKHSDSSDSTDWCFCIVVILGLLAFAAWIFLV